MSNIGIGIELIFLGMGVTFLALIFLTYVMVALGYLPGGSRKKGKNQVETVPEPVNPAMKSTREDSSEIPLETIAAITGAIASLMGTTTGSFAIRSIRPCSGNFAPSPWTVSGRIDRMNTGNILIKRRTSR